MNMQMDIYLYFGIFLYLWQCKCHYCKL